MLQEQDHFGDPADLEEGKSSSRAKASSSSAAQSGHVHEEPIGDADGDDPDAPIEVPDVDFDTWCSNMGLEHRGNLSIYHSGSGLQIGKLYNVWGCQTLASSL